MRFLLIALICCSCSSKQIEVSEPDNCIGYGAEILCEEGEINATKDIDGDTDIITYDLRGGLPEDNKQ